MRGRHRFGRLRGWWQKKVRVYTACPAGVGHERILAPDGDRERLFRLAWQNVHAGPPYGGSTHSDLLARLMQEPAPNGQRWLFGYKPVSRRDRVVAATVIQWLGTNVGWAFLWSVLEECAERESLRDMMRDVESWSRLPRLREAVRDRLAELRLAAEVRARAAAVGLQGGLRT